MYVLINMADFPAVMPFKIWMDHLYSVSIYLVLLCWLLSSLLKL